MTRLVRLTLARRKLRQAAEYADLAESYRLAADRIDEAAEGFLDEARVLVGSPGARVTYLPLAWAATRH